jgi:hypothetical protein
MEHLCREVTRLFPAPKEIEFSCSCPDYASMCKHVAAVLYGIGARLDHQPELSFRLRQVDAHQLIASASAAPALGKNAPARSKVLGSGDLASVFGIDLATPAKAVVVPVPMHGRGAIAARAREQGQVTPVPAKPTASAAKTSVSSGKPTPFGRTAPPPRPPKRPGLSAAQRKAVSERMRRYWAERRKAATPTPDDVGRASTSTRYPAPPKRSGLSAAQRKAVSERMTRYWAARRKSRRP